MQRAIEKRKLGKTGEMVTFTGFGALEIGRDWGLGAESERRRPAEDRARRTLETVLDSGINLIDTARAYHRSEERIGKFVSERRKEFFLATKCGEHSEEPSTYYDFSYRAVSESIEKSLNLLKTDRIDLLQIHFGPEPEKVLDDGETLAAMKDARKKGKVRFLGASAWERVAWRCLESGEFDVLQLEYSLLNMKDGDVIDECGRRGIGVLIRGGLAYGKLTPRVVPHIDEIPEAGKIRKLIDLLEGDAKKLTALAMRFLYGNKSISSVLMGTKNPEHVVENLKLLDVPIDGSILERAVEICRFG